MTFEIKSDQVNVEEIMRLIRKRIEEKRQGLYSDEEIREIAEHRLEAALDARDFDVDLASELRARSPRWNYKFDEHTLYYSSRGAVGQILGTLRTLLNPLLKLFLNPNPLIQALHRQSGLNTYYVRLLHEYAVELTKVNLEVAGLKNRVLELTGRLDMLTRREKTLEDMVVYRADAAGGEPPAGEGRA